MRSRATGRLTSGLLAGLALGGAAFFLATGEHLIRGRRTASRAFDLAARQATYTLADLRAAEQAYVAAGQGEETWAPAVATRLATATQAVDDLQHAAVSESARGVLAEAAANLVKFGAADQRVRDYLEAGQRLMAADVVFEEAEAMLLAVVRQVEAAVLAEHQTLDLAEAATRRQQMYSAGSLAVLALCIIVWLSLGSPRGEASPLAALAASDSPTASPGPTLPGDLLLRPDPRPEPPADTIPAAVSPVGAIADLCSGFATVRDASDLEGLLARTAGLMAARGLIVWLGSPSGAELHPVAAHGYAADQLSRLPPVPRGASNAAAEAYRSGRRQIVPARPGSAAAIVSPLLSRDGCTGVLTAELTEGSEVSEEVVALAAIVAAQLAIVLMPSPAVQEVDSAPVDRMASA